jgi:hypothetical protein
MQWPNDLLGPCNPSFNLAAGLKLKKNNPTPTQKACLATFFADLRSAKSELSALQTKRGRLGSSA